jgi:hypothetical protein
MFARSPVVPTNETTEPLEKGNMKHSSRLESVSDTTKVAGTGSASENMAHPSVGCNSINFTRSRLEILANRIGHDTRLGRLVAPATDKPPEQITEPWH